MTDEKAELLEPLEPLGWLCMGLGALQPISLIVQIVLLRQSGIVFFWLLIECLLFGIALHAGSLLIRKSRYAILWANAAGGAMLVSAAGPAGYYRRHLMFLLCDAPMVLLQDFLRSPNALLQLIQIPVWIYFLIIMLGSRWHRGLLAEWSPGGLTSARQSCALGAAVALVFQIAWYVLKVDALG